MYKKDFQEFNDMLNQATSYIINHKGEEVISERHQKDYKKPGDVDLINESNSDELPSSESFTDIKFEDI